MPNKFYSDVNPESKEKPMPGKGNDDGRLKGKEQGASKASFKEGENPNASVPKLGSQSGAE